MEKLEVDFLCEAHETYSFVLNLGDQRLIRAILSCDELCNEVLSISLCDGLGLRVENIGEIIMILLFGQSNFNEGQHIQTRREISVRVAMDSANSLQRCRVLHRQPTEIAL